MIDTSGYTIDLTLWGSQAITLPWKPESKEPILSIRGVKVSDFNSNFEKEIFYFLNSKFKKKKAIL